MEGASRIPAAGATQTGDHVELTRMLMDAPWMLAYWDRDLVCRYANRALEAWFGADPGGLIGRHVRDVLGPELYELNRPYIECALGGQAQVFERELVRNGTRRDVMVYYIPNMTSGVFGGFMGMVVEMTAQRKAENALRAEQAARTQTETYARRLDELLREREEMLDVLAHEVRQPLHNAQAALSGAAQTLSGAGQAEASRRVAGTQEMISEILADVDNSLAVAVLVGRKEPIERADTDIDTLVAVTIADMPASQRPRIHVERATHTRTASMDMGLVRLALRNLLANALKFSPPGSRVTLRILDLSLIHI